MNHDIHILIFFSNYKKWPSTFEKFSQIWLYTKYEIQFLITLES
jgi:hypothetical protein